MSETTRNSFLVALGTFALMLLLAALISACAPPVTPEGSPTGKNLGSGLQRVIDEEAQVVCWIYDGYNAGGLSCLPISETALEQ